jgi:hypothetical protein
MQEEQARGYLGRSVNAAIAFANRGYAIRDIRVTIRAADDRFVTVTVTPPVSADPEHEALWNQPRRVLLEKLLAMTPDLDTVPR